MHADMEEEFRGVVVKALLVQRAGWGSHERAGEIPSVRCPPKRGSSSVPCARVRVLRNMLRN